MHSLLPGALSWLFVLTVLLRGAQSQAQVDAAPPLLTLSVGQAERDVPRSGVAAIEASESGGITDVFLRLMPGSADALADLTGDTVGQSLALRVCDTVLMAATVRERIDTGTIYLAGTTMVRAEAIRALWHGRASCDTLAPEVFEHGQ